MTGKGGQYYRNIQGKIYIQSDLGRLMNFSGTNHTLFSATPVRIGISQPVFGFNTFKWEKRIEPLKYWKAKLEYIQSTENVALETINLYFNLVMAEQNLKICETDLANADTLYSIGQKRQSILAIDKADLLTLRLDKIDAAYSLKDARNNFSKALSDFNTYLGISQSAVCRVTVPDSLGLEQINVLTAIETARKCSPFYLSQQQELESNRDLEKSKIQSRFSSALDLSFGLNQRSNALSEVYKGLLNQQIVNFSLQIPLIVWGLKKGQFNLARSQQKVLFAKLKQNAIDFEQDIRITVNEFNLQKEFVKSAEEASNVAVLLYEMNKQRFLLGKIDVNTLSYQLSRKESAVLGYISALRKYWQLYYKVRMITLFNFEKNISLEKELEEKMD